MMNLMTLGTLGLLVTLAEAGDASAAIPSVAAPTTAAAAGAGASADSPSLASFKRAIRAKYDLKEKAFAAHDVDTIVTKFYSPDVISVGEGEGIYIGRDQLRPLYEDVVRTNTVKVDSVYTYVNGNAGWDWADFHVYPLDPNNKSFTFAIVFLWTKINGEWMCKGDVFLNGSLRSGKLAPSPPPAK